MKPIIPDEAINTAEMIENGCIINNGMEQIIKIILEAVLIDLYKQLNTIPHTDTSIPMNDIV